jgi:hypothetical protein
MDSQLRQISALVQERRYDEARAALQPYLREHPDAANGWYLLSFVAETPAAKKQAIQKAIQLAPDNEKYAARAAKLSTAAPRSMKLPLLIGGLVLIAVLAVVFVLLRPSATPADTTLPTLAATDGVASSPTSAENTQIAAVASATGEIILSAQATTTLAPTHTETMSAIATPLLPTLSASDVPNPTVDSTAPVFIITAPTAQSTALLPTAGSSQNGTQQPTQSSPQAPTSTPSQTPQPGAPTSTPILAGDVGAPLSTPLEIGAGSMRVVAATRPGSSLIAELGGQAPAPPSGQDWVVIEALIICSGNTNCAPKLSNLNVVSASGATYAPAPDFNMSPLFGPGGFMAGQVWGYMGFRVPTSETGLRLVLSQGGKTYTFALQ